MISTFKNFLIIAVKNAINAILTNGAMMTMLPSVFTIHTAAGWWNIAKLTGGVVVAREVAVWVPILLKWSTTNADPNLEVVQKPIAAPTQTVIQPKPPEQPVAPKGT
jgi:hypothetical protein